MLQDVISSGDVKVPQVVMEELTSRGSSYGLYLVWQQEGCDDGEVSRRRHLRWSFKWLR